MLELGCLRLPAAADAGLAQGPHIMSRAQWAPQAVVCHTVTAPDPQPEKRLNHSFILFAGGHARRTRACGWRTLRTTGRTRARARAAWPTRRTGLARRPRRGEPAAGARTRPRTAWTTATRSRAPSARWGCAAQDAFCTREGTSVYLDSFVTHAYVCLETCCMGQTPRDTVDGTLAGMLSGLCAQPMQHCWHGPGLCLCRW